MDGRVLTADVALRADDLLASPLKRFVFVQNELVHILQEFLIY